MTKSKVSRLEVDVRRLLSKCEEMAKKDDDMESWRLVKFIESAEEMIKGFKSPSMKANADDIEKYTKRVEFLKGLLETRKMENLMLKSIAIQKLAPPSTLNATVTKEIYQKHIASCENDLRRKLFQDSPEFRNRFASTEPSGSQEFDSLLRYHTDRHEQIASDMLTMTRSMKEQSELAGKIIRDDTKCLEKSSTLMEDNYQHLHHQSSRLQMFIASSGWNCWIWIMLAAMIIIFINMVFFMRLFKKKE